MFVPHGVYGLAGPLDLRGGCAHLVGAGPHSAELSTLLHPWRPNGCWPSAGGGTSAMLTSYPRGGEAVGEALALAQATTLVSGFNLGKRSGCPVIDLHAGKYLLRGVGVGNAATPTPNPPTSLSSSAPTEPAEPAEARGGAAEVCRDTSYVALRNAVSGRFYGLPLDGCDLRQCESSPRHVLLLVEGCKEEAGEIHLYQPSTEHLINT